MIGYRPGKNSKMVKRTALALRFVTNLKEWFPCIVPGDFKTFLKERYKDDFRQN